MINTTKLTKQLTLLFGLSCLVLCVEAADLEFDLPGVHVRDYALSQDGTEVYLTMESMAKDASQIIVMKRQGTKWSEPEIASFSGQYKDLEPFLHPNGLQLFFASNRNAEQTAATQQFDLWQVSRSNVDSPWSKAKRLPEIINTSDGNEFFPSVSNNGNLYFTATKASGIGKEDIYVSRWVDGNYTEAEILPETINSATYEFNAYISPDEKLLIFSSYGRADDLGGGDLYFSRLIDGSWQEAENMGPKINSKGLDYCPFYDHQSQTLYWTSNRSSLTEYSDSIKTFDQWYDLYTHGENGLSKIYRKPFELSNKEG